MSPTQNADKLIPMTIMDAMILIAAAAVSLSTLKYSGTRGSDWAPTREPLEQYALIAAGMLSGPTYLGPLVIGLQYIRGRRRQLFPGEWAWLLFVLPTLFLVVGQCRATWEISVWGWQPRTTHHLFYSVLLWR
jgi:hypothetical protein